MRAAGRAALRAARARPSPAAARRYEAIGQKGVTLWFTGLSGSGKSTIAEAFEQQVVQEMGKHVYRLDGDNLRKGLNKDLRCAVARPPHAPAAAALTPASVGAGSTTRTGRRACAVRARSR